jgi:hypothetical protein
MMLVPIFVDTASWRGHGRLLLQDLPASLPASLIHARFTRGSAFLVVGRQDFPVPPCKGRNRRSDSRLVRLPAEVVFRLEGPPQFHLEKVTDWYHIVRWYFVM